MDTQEVKRKYRLNQWIEIVRQCRSSGQTVSAWCAENNINLKQYYYWLRRVRTAACELLPMSERAVIGKIIQNYLYTLTEANLSINH